MVAAETPKRRGKGGARRGAGRPRLHPATMSLPRLTRLEELLAASGTSKTRAAALLDMPRWLFSEMVNGKRDYREHLPRLAHLLGVPLWAVVPDDQEEQA